MAVDVCSEISSAGISPRFSFSRDRDPKTDTDPLSVQDRCGKSESSVIDFEFNFCIGNNSFIHEFSSADELFANGKILAIDIKKSTITKQPKSINPQPKKTNSDCRNVEKKLLKEFLLMSIDDEEDEKSSSKSFWQFKRSNSLNCDTTRTKGLIRSLHFLSRSNSTGSAPNPPKLSIPLSKEKQKPSLQKQTTIPRRKSSSSAPSSGAFYPYVSLQKDLQLRKCGSQGSGVKFNPVLNIPSRYISKGTISLLSSIFCSGKVKKKK